MTRHCIEREHPLERKRAERKNDCLIDSPRKNFDWSCTGEPSEREYVFTENVAVHRPANSK